MGIEVQAPILELLGFLSVYDDKIVKLALALRRFVVTEAPGATETIYDAYNVVVGYSSTGGRRRAAVTSLSIPSTLIWDFYRGTELPDPGTFEGTGKQVRHVTIRGLGDSKIEYLRRLVRVAIKKSKELAHRSAYFEKSRTSARFDQIGVLRLPSLCRFCARFGTFT